MLNNSLYTTSLLLILFMGLAHTSYAQDPTLSKGGRFKVDYVKGCAPLSVTITEEIDQSYEVRQYRYYQPGGETGQLQSGKPTFTFEEVSTYYIIQYIQNATPQTDTIQIEVEAPQLPYFTASNCGNGQVWVEALRDSSQYDYYMINGDPNLELNTGNAFQQAISLPPGTRTVSLKGMYRGAGVQDNCGEETKSVLVTDELRPAFINEVRASITNQHVTIHYSLQPDASQVLEVQQANGSFSPRPEPLEGNQLTIPLDPSSNYFCFRIRTDNRCDGTSLYSNMVCTAQLSGTAEENHNSVRFNTNSQLPASAELLRDGNLLQAFNSASTGTYEDDQIVCNTVYAYAIRLSYANASSITEGLEIQNQFNGTPPAPQNLASRWENSEIIFEFLQDNLIPNARYRAYRPEGTPPRLVNRADTNFITLPATGQNNCFRFSYIDACDNESVLSAPVCALYLRNTAREPDGLLLEWNEYTGYANGVQNYTISKYDAQGNFVRSYPMGLQTSLDLGEQPLEESGSRYMVTAYSNDLLTESSSNLLEFRILMQGYFPNAFTPDGDELNDYFKVEGKFVERSRLQIFNRWGEQIFETTDLQRGWDGTIKGQPAPQDNYVYRAFVETIDGGQQTHRGSVFLIRK